MITAMLEKPREMLKKAIEVKKLGSQIADIIENDLAFVVDLFPLDKNLRNYQLFLNSYRLERDRRSHQASHQAYEQIWSAGEIVYGHARLSRAKQILSRM